MIRRVAEICFQTLTYEQQLASEALYRDANTLLYADNKPSEEAIDRVISKLNIEYVSCYSSTIGFLSNFVVTLSQDKRNKFSRKRLKEDEGDITYINERNRVFNKKVCFYFLRFLCLLTYFRLDRSLL